MWGHIGTWIVVVVWLPRVYLRLNIKVMLMVFRVMLMVLRVVRHMVRIRLG